MVMLVASFIPPQAFRLTSPSSNLRTATTNRFAFYSSKCASFCSPAFFRPQFPPLLNKNEKNTNSCFFSNPRMEDSIYDDAKPISDPAEVDYHIQRLGHVNKALRQSASFTLAASKDLHASVIVPKLLDLLKETNTDLRRQAVQTLGMIGGDDVLYLIMEKLKSTDSLVERASAVKTMSSIALRDPSRREFFPEDILEDLMVALLYGKKNNHGFEIDPVSKLSITILIGVLAASDPDSEAKRSEKAFEVLIEVARDTEDVGLATALVGSLGQMWAVDRDPKIEQTLNYLIMRNRGVEGDGFVKETARAQLEKIAQLK